MHISVTRTNKDARGHQLRSEGKHCQNIVLVPALVQRYSQLSVSMRLAKAASLLMRSLGVKHTVSLLRLCFTVLKKTAPHRVSCPSRRPAVPLHQVCLQLPYAAARWRPGSQQIGHQEAAWASRLLSRRTAAGGTGFAEWSWSIGREDTLGDGSTQPQSAARGQSFQEMPGGAHIISLLRCQTVLPTSLFCWVVRREPRPLTCSISFCSRQHTIFWTVGAFQPAELSACSLPPPKYPYGR